MTNIVVEKTNVVRKQLKYGTIGQEYCL
nr:unnamed protein product [Callosobruchus chinensis]